MYVNCLICNKINPSADIYATECGHVFHHACLLREITKSKRCRQCQNPVSEKNILQLFFDFPNLNNAQQNIHSVIAQNSELNQQIQILKQDLSKSKLELQQKELNIERTREFYAKEKEQMQKIIDENQDNCSTILGAMHANEENFKKADYKNQILAQEISSLRKALHNYRAVNDSDNFNGRIEAEHKLHQLQNELKTRKDEITQLKTDNQHLQEKLTKSRENWELERTEMWKIIERLNNGERPHVGVRFSNNLETIHVIPNRHDTAFLD